MYPSTMYLTTKFLHHKKIAHKHNLRGRDKYEICTRRKPTLIYFPQNSPSPSPTPLKMVVYFLFHVPSGTPAWFHLLLPKIGKYLACGGVY